MYTGDVDLHLQHPVARLLHDFVRAWCFGDSALKGENFYRDGANGAGDWEEDKNLEQLDLGWVRSRSRQLNVDADAEGRDQVRDAGINDDLIDEWAKVAQKYLPQPPVGASLERRQSIDLLFPSATDEGEEN